MKYVLLITTFLLSTNLFAQEIDKGWMRSVPDAIERCNKYDAQFIQAGWDYDLSPTFLKSIAVLESLCKPDAVSSAKAIGLLQTKVSAQKDTGIEGDLKDPLVSIQVGAKYFSILKEKYDYPYAEALAVGYHDGPTGGKKVLRNNEVFDHMYVRKLQYVLKQIPLI